MRKKTIQHTINRTQKNDWKNCKYLGTLLDTETDIERHKNLTYIAFNKYRQTLTCRNLPLYPRIKLFHVYVTSIFMHNSEHWTLRKSQENFFDAFHRQLRQLLNIHYPNIITNTDIYAMTRQHYWTDKINQNKHRFTRHILTLPEGTPARQALQIALKPVTRPRGQQKTTWIQSTNTLLQSVGLDNLGSNKLQEATNNNKTWKQKTDEVLRGRRALDSALSVSSSS